MRRSPRCPKCDCAMDEGCLIDQGYGAVAVPKWQPGPPKKSIWAGLKQTKKAQIEVSTWRCGRCGYLENYALKD